METRKFRLESMLKIAAPVLKSFSEGMICRDMPPLEKVDEFGNVFRDKDNSDVAYLEVLGRALAGIAPWLEVELLDGEEKNLQEEYRNLP